MLEVVYEVEGQSRRHSLGGTVEIFLGRSSDNAIVLNDFSVSRKHASLRPENGQWVIEDLKSTNGLKVNGKFQTKSPVVAGDVLTVGTFTLTVREELPEPVVTDSISDSSNTFVRSIADFNRDFQLDHSSPDRPSVSSTQAAKRLTSPAAREKIFEILVQVAKTLIVAREVNEILGRVVDLLFDFLPVERAVVVLIDPDGRLVPSLARHRGKTGIEVTEPF